MAGNLNVAMFETLVSRLDRLEREVSSSANAVSHPLVTNRTQKQKRLTEDVEEMSGAPAILGLEASEKQTGSEMASETPKSKPAPPRPLPAPAPATHRGPGAISPSRPLEIKIDSPQPRTHEHEDKQKMKHRALSVPANPWAMASMQRVPNLQEACTLKQRERLNWQLT